MQDSIHRSQVKSRKVPYVRVQTLTDNPRARRAHTLGWCAAFVQFGHVHVVMRAQVR